MGRYDFESPGAAFTGQIAEALTQRKAEERQRLLDSLQFSADQRAQEAAAREERESQARLQSQKQRDILEELGTISGFMEPGEDPTSRGLSPEAIEAGRRYGMWKDVSEPQVSTSITSMTDEQGTPTEGFKAEATTEAAPKKRLGYVGDAKQRERLRKRTEQGNVIVGMLTSQDSNKRQIGEMLAQVASANDGEIPAEFLQYLAPEAPLYTFDEPSGKVAKSGATLPPNARVVTRGYSPRQLQGHQWINVGANDAGETMLFDPNSQETVIIPGSHKATNPEESPLGVPQGTLQAHRETSMLLKPDETGKVDPVRVGMFRQSALQVIASAKAAPTVKKLAQMFIVDTPTYEQAIRSAQLNEHEINQLHQLIGTLATPETSEILKRNPVQQFKDPNQAKPWWKDIF